MQKLVASTLYKEVSSQHTAGAGSQPTTGTSRKHSLARNIQQELLYSILKFIVHLAEATGQYSLEGRHPTGQDSSVGEHLAEATREDSSVGEHLAEATREDFSVGKHLAEAARQYSRLAIRPPLLQMV